MLAHAVEAIVAGSSRLSRKQPDRHRTPNVGKRRLGGANAVMLSVTGRPVAAPGLRPGLARSRSATTGMSGGMPCPRRAPDVLDVRISPTARPTVTISDRGPSVHTAYCNSARHRYLGVLRQPSGGQTGSLGFERRGCEHSPRGGVRAVCICPGVRSGASGSSANGHMAAAPLNGRSFARRLVDGTARA